MRQKGGRGLDKDKEIIEKIKKEDESGIELILNEYGAWLNGVVYKYLSHSKWDREECLSDIITSIWYHIEDFNPEKNSFKRWIAAIAKYKAIDYLRKLQANQASVSKLKVLESLHKNSKETISSIEINEMLQSLTEVEKRIFEKYYIEGFSAHEIAETLQKKPSWIHNKLSRGRKKLRKYS